MKEKFSMTLIQRGMALFLSSSLVLVGVRDEFPYQTDALIARILLAAAYPVQVVEAGRWTEQNKNLSKRPTGATSRRTTLGSQCQGLILFPTPLAAMNQNPPWKSEPGDAHIDQQQELAQAMVERISPI